MFNKVNEFMIKFKKSLNLSKLLKIIKMSYISYIEARQILDSRGNPTVEVDVFTEI